IESVEPGQSDTSFEELYNQYAHKVYRTCLSMTNDLLDAQDFTQDIFIKVFLKMHSFQNRSSFSTWLYSISYNYCLDRLRLSRQLKTESLSAEMSNSLPDDTSLDRVLGIQLSEEMEQRVKAQKMALNRLPEQEQTLLRLKYEEGLSIRALSAAYQLSE